MKLRYYIAIALALLAGLVFTNPELDLEFALEELDDTPLVQSAFSKDAIDPASYTIEVNPVNEVKILGSRNVAGGYELTIYSSAPYVKYDNRVFQFHQPGQAVFFVPEDRKQKVKLL
ncbi:hypothetical protein D3C71_79820 [compost metagenome]